MTKCRAGFATDNNLALQYKIDSFCNTNSIHDHDNRYAECALCLSKQNLNYRKKIVFL